MGGARPRLNGESPPDGAGSLVTSDAQQKGFLVSDDTATPPSAAAVWVDRMIRAAYPQTAGITLAALEALGDHETLTMPQVAYLMSVMFDLGAQTRTAGDRAEVLASCAANFSPRATRDERIRLRVAAMGEQHEIAWLRRTGEPAPEPWPGGDAAAAAARYGWDADRPDYAAPDISLRVREVRRGVHVWRDET